MLHPSGAGIPNAKVEALNVGINITQSTNTNAQGEYRISNLPPGTYGISILDATTQKSPYTVSFVLQQIGTDWKLGGLFLRPAQLSGHDSKWYLDHANTYKSKGQVHNAWLYYLEGRELALSVPFMETQAIDKLYDQESSMKPADIPTGGNTADLVASDGKTYKPVSYTHLTLPTILLV